MSRGLLAAVLTAAGFDVFTAATADEAIDAFVAVDPDALITDIDLGAGATGLDLVVSLSARNPHLPVVVLSNYVITPDYTNPVLSRAAYLRKKDLGDTGALLVALDTVLREQGSQTGPDHGHGGRLAALTTSQIHVLRMIAVGMSNAEIAEHRRCSLRAAEHMVQRTFTALGLGADPRSNTRVIAARIYIEEAGMPAIEEVAPQEF